jgi:Uma2 family endonuclease
MSSPKPILLTPGEYLEIERKAEIRSEYIAGRIYAMAGASRRHNLIAGNFLATLKGQLRGKPCETYMADMRVKVSPTGLYTYPDVIAVCGQPQFEDAFVDTLLNPTLIVEVLSETTEAYDRGDKFAQYRNLDSLREYVLVSQNKLRVEDYLRDGEHWVLSEVRVLGESIGLTSIGCEIQLAAIYEGVDFESEVAGR